MVLAEAHMVEVPLEYLQRLLPRPPATSGAESWSTVLTELEGRGALDHDAWTRLPGGTSFKKQHEDIAFKPLETIINDIIAVCQKHLPSMGAPTLNLRLLPNRTPSGDKKDKSCPDGVMIADGEPTPSLEQYTWTNISVTFEFKREDKDDLDGRLGLKNSEQCVWGLQQMLWANPDRRFAFAVTIEATSVRFWLAHRAAVLISTPFHLQKSRTSLLRAFLSFAFGSRDALGWDPTMKRSLNGGSLFSVTVSKADYTIIKTIQDHRARALHGSACRVFLALNAAKQEFAIKDVWRNCKRTPEGQIFNNVLEDIEAMKEKLGMDREAIKEHFVNVVNHGDVVLNGSIDETQTTMAGEDVPPDAVVIKTDTVASEQYDDTIGSHKSSMWNMEAPHGRGRVNDRMESVTIHHRIHYRTVMENVGTPLHLVETLEEAFKALSDIVKACRMMCLAGYNHRDLSTGNIIVDKLGQGRLGDLEFAKKYRSDEGGHTERTGTLDFMAIEVIRGKYSFRKPGTVNKHGYRPFRHNAGHDLESTWWIAVFLLYNNVIGDNVDPGKAVRQKRHMDYFFDRENRVGNFQSPYPTEDMLTHFDPQVKPAIQHLQSMVEVLKQAYETMENAEDNDEGRNHEFVSVHDYFARMLLEMSKIFKDTTCTRLEVVMKRRERSASVIQESPTAKRAKKIQSLLWSGHTYCGKYDASLKYIHPALLCSAESDVNGVKSTATTSVVLVHCKVD